MNARRGVIPLIAALVGVAVMAWSFTAGISAALDGSGSGSFAYQVVFIAAGLVVLASLVVAIVQLARGGSKPLAISTIVVALLPIVSIIALVIVNR